MNKDTEHKPVKTITTKGDVTAVDIPTMAKMSSEEYEQYLRNYELVMVDHHGVLRSGPAGYPLAVTQAQVKALISYLKELAPSIGK